MADLLTSFPVIIEVPVAWGEMDALQHVNNSVYFRYFESARMAYFEAINYMDFMQDTGVGPILAATQATFKLPLTYPDTVSVGAKVSQMQEDRFLMEYKAISQKKDLIAAIGDGLIVSYDYRNKRKAPVPELIKKRILDLQKGLSGS